MKTLGLTLALFFILVTGICNTNAFVLIETNVNTQATLQTRDIVNALQLNEADYLKIKVVVKALILEVEQAKVTFKGNEEGLKTALTQIAEQTDAAILQVLNPSKQESYLAYKHQKQGATPQYVSQL